MKKILSVVLAAIMICSAIPMMGYAYDIDYSNGQCITKTETADIVTDAAFMEADSTGIDNTSFELQDGFQIIERLESESVRSVDSITIEGVKYGKADNIEIHTITTELAIVQKGDTATRDWWPYHNKKWTWGTSYVQNTEIGYLHYRGKARAMGNVHKGKRAIQASITYKRGNKVLKKGISNAKYQSNRWIAGPEKVITVTDTVNPNAEPTKVYYNFVTVNPNVTG